jgi:hypothetical protein
MVAGRLRPITTARCRSPSTPDRMPHLLRQATSGPGHGLEVARDGVSVPRATTPRRPAAFPVVVAQKRRIR